MPLRARVKCVPNVSEGRDPATIQALADAIETHPVKLLHVDADPDHHRTVFTFVGPADAVGDAAVGLAHQTVDRIDLTRHRGVHPRMGALDVVPFVPLAGAAMADCVCLARQVGERIAGSLGLPVYLYGEAAATPQRRALADIRRGQFEGLFDKIGRPEWVPDFGPAHVHPSAGGVAVGARGPLIAFNVWLDSEDLAAARDIARAVRHSNGGLPHLQALGLPLARQGGVQVSMNLTDYGRTSLADAFKRVSEAAAQRGIQIARSEIVGMVPRRALPDAARSALKLGAAFADDQILDEEF